MIRKTVKVVAALVALVALVALAACQQEETCEGMRTIPDWVYSTDPMERCVGAMLENQLSPDLCEGLSQ